LASLYQAVSFSVTSSNHPRALGRLQLNRYYEYSAQADFSVPNEYSRLLIKTKSDTICRSYRDFLPEADSGRLPNLLLLTPYEFRISLVN
jgi:hypothetical protein